MHNGMFLWMSNDKVGDGYTIKITGTDVGKRSWFYYDTRTKTVRSFVQKNLVMSNQHGFTNQIGRNTAFRPYTAGLSDQIITFPGKSIRASFGMCLTPHNWAVTEGNIMTWWHCGGNVN